jgi:acyl-CoA thioester hydrolase
LARADFKFFHGLRVRWAEVDMQQVVFNGHYLMYFDVAVMEYWRHLGFNYPKDLVQTLSCDSMAVKSVVEYHQPAKFDDWIEVGVRCDRIGNSSMHYCLEIHRGNEHLISGELFYVVVDAQHYRSTRVPEAMRQRFRDFEGTSLIE